MHTLDLNTYFVCVKDNAWVQVIIIFQYAPLSNIWMYQFLHFRVVDFPDCLLAVQALVCSDQI